MHRADQEPGGPEIGVGDDDAGCMAKVETSRTRKWRYSLEAMPWRIFLGRGSFGKNNVAAMIGDLV